MLFAKLFCVFYNSYLSFLSIQKNFLYALEINFKILYVNYMSHINYISYLSYMSYASYMSYISYMNYVCRLYGLYEICLFYEFFYESLEIT